MEPIVKNTRWLTEDDTRDSAHRLAQVSQVGNAVIELHGDLGAGKTTWVRHLLRALGVAGRIKSPTYGVVEPHQGLVEGKPVAVWHFDFYRLEDPQEWHEAGLRDLFGQAGLKLVEWPAKAGPHRPLADLALHITCDEHGTRHVRAEAATACGQALQEAL